MKAFDPQWIAFRNFVKTGIQFAVCTKTTPWFLRPLNSICPEYLAILVRSSPSERNRVCVEALLVVWSDLSERAREFDSHLWKSLWVTLIAIGFVLVFRAQLSGAKFNVVAELRAPTTDLCDLGLSVDPGTVFVSLYFAQVLRESCLCFRYGRRICKRRCGSGTDTAWREKQSAQGPQRFRMNSPEGGQGLPGGATAPYAHAPPPPPKAASGSMAGSPTGQQEVFSTAQMTQIAQIVALSLNQAMGEFNMRLNGLQQQVVHQQNVFAQAQVQQAASQPFFSRVYKLHHNQLRYQFLKHHHLSQVVCHHLEIVHPPVHNPIFQGTLWNSHLVSSSRLRD